MIENARRLRITLADRIFASILAIVLMTLFVFITPALSQSIPIPCLTPSQAILNYIHDIRVTLRERSGSVFHDVPLNHYPTMIITANHPDKLEQLVFIVNTAGMVCEIMLLLPEHKLSMRLTS